MHDVMKHHLVEMLQQEISECKWPHKKNSEEDTFGDRDAHPNTAG